MNPILRKKYLRSEYIFYSDSIQKIKKGKIIKEITLNDIEEITYNEKFGFVDFVKILVDRLQPYFHFPKALIIVLKTKPNIISIKLEIKEYELLKLNFNKIIKLI